MMNKTLKIDTNNSKSEKIGVIFGKFFPIHLGHIHMINEALNQVDFLHIIVCSETDRDLALLNNSQFQKPVNPKIRMDWVMHCFKHYPEYGKTMRFHHLNEDGLPKYPHGWKEWSHRVQKMLKEKNIHATIIFSSEFQDKKAYQSFFNLPVQLIDVERSNVNISATKIRNEPFKYWEFLSPLIRTYFVKMFVVLGENEFKNHRLQSQLQSYFNTSATSNNTILREQLALKLQNNISSSAPLGRIQLIPLLSKAPYKKALMALIKHWQKQSLRANKIMFTDGFFIALQLQYYQATKKMDARLGALITRFKVHQVFILSPNQEMQKNEVKKIGVNHQQDLIFILKTYNIPFQILDGQSDLENYRNAQRSILTLLP